MSDEGILFLIMFGPLIVWWIWIDHKFERDMKRWRREDEELRQRIRDREGW